MPYGLGIDLGGTKILAGVIDLETGKALSQTKKRTKAQLGSDEMVSRLLKVAQDAITDAKLPAGEKVQSVGIGGAGQIDRTNGIMISAPNLASDLKDLPLAKLVSERLKLPVALYNDVEAAAAGEANYGAGKGYRDFVCVFVGTGIGAAIMHDGLPYRGASHTAGEIGHMVVDQGGRLCGCGGRGHLEAYASRSAIARVLVAEIMRGRPTVLRSLVPSLEGAASQPGGTAIRSGAIAQAVAARDELAMDAVVEGAQYLAVGLASVIAFYNPPRIILGGGLIMAVDLFFDTAVRMARQTALPLAGQSVQLVRSGLGDTAGIVGAAVLGAMTTRGG